MADSCDTCSGPNRWSWSAVLLLTDGAPLPTLRAGRTDCATPAARQQPSAAPTTTPTNGPTGILIASFASSSCWRAQTRDCTGHSSTMSNERNAFEKESVTCFAQDPPAVRIRRCFHGHGVKMLAATTDLNNSQKASSSNSCQRRGQFASVRYRRSENFGLRRGRRSNSIDECTSAAASKVPSRMVDDRGADRHSVPDDKAIKASRHLQTIQV